MNSKAFKCKFKSCNKVYCSYHSLRRHEKTYHLGIRKYKCLICDKFLSSKQNCKDHQNIHTKAKPYICEYPDCNNMFRQLGQYNIHKKIHEPSCSANMIRISSETKILRILCRNLSIEPVLTYKIPSLPYSSNIQLPEIKCCKEKKN